VGFASRIIFVSITKISQIIDMRRGKVVTGSIKGYERIIERMRSGKIVYFENSFEEIALKYVPSEPGRFFAKYYGQKEYKIEHSSNVVCHGLSEGRIISKARYENYDIGKYY
jgi:hypothetical protein